MEGKSWQKAKEILYEALEREVARRPDFLDVACKGNDELRKEVETLLEAHERAEGFFDKPPSDVAAEMMAEHSNSTSKASAEGPPDSVVGQSLGHYHVISHLGAGGMGEVYLARDDRLGRKVALKLLPVYFTHNEDRMRRFRHEARSVSGLNHPNILTIHEIGEVNERHFIATEYIEGETLRQHMGRTRMDAAEAVEIAVQVASALAEAHAAGIVHRDIKPENIMVRHDGLVKILDFGLVKLTEKASQDFDSQASTLIQTEPNVVMGTVRYMSPEQARGLAVDARTDIWSLGVVLYEMITGQAPFEGETSTDVMMSVLQKEPPPLTAYHQAVSPELERVVQKLLLKDRAERYQTTQELLGDLKRVDQGLELGRLSSSETVMMTDRPPLPFRRRLFAMVGCVALALAGAGYFLRDRVRPAEKPPEEVTVAVLPFRALNASEEIGFLSIGLPDAIITRLANVRQMQLRPTSAILRYEKQDVDVQEVGRALASGHIVIGTLQKVGDRLRVNVQLVRTSDGVTLWGGRYDKSRGDLLNLQDEISGQIAAALRIKMSGDEHDRVYRRYTQNAAAYELSLQGRAHLMRYTKDATLAAVKAFEQALQLDSQYALAHAGLAGASAQMRIRYASENELRQWEDRAHKEAQQALDLDPNLAEAHEARAAVYRNSEFNWEQTIAESDRSLELNPNLEMPHYYRAAAYYHLGLLEQVEADVRSGMAINPENRVEPLRLRGTTALFDGRYAESAAALEEAQRLSDSVNINWYLAQAYYYQKQRERAETMLADLRGSAQVEQRSKATLASFLAARGERERAGSLLREVTERGYMDHHVAYSIGVAYAQLGDHDESLKWLAKAVETGLPCYPWYERDPLLQPIRADDEFQRFMTQLQKSWETAKARHAGQ